jgi:hypothetical protein
MLKTVKDKCGRKDDTAVFKFSCCGEQRRLVDALKVNSTEGYEFVFM